MSLKVHTLSSVKVLNFRTPIVHNLNTFKVCNLMSLKVHNLRS